MKSNVFKIAVFYLVLQLVSCALFSSLRLPESAGQWQGRQVTGALPDQFSKYALSETRFYLYTHRSFKDAQILVAYAGSDLDHYALGAYLETRKPYRSAFKIKNLTDEKEDVKTEQVHPAIEAETKKPRETITPVYVIERERGQNNFGPLTLSKGGWAHCAELTNQAAYHRDKKFLYAVASHNLNKQTWVNFFEELNKDAKTVKVRPIEFTLFLREESEIKQVYFSGLGNIPGFKNTHGFFYGPWLTGQKESASDENNDADDVFDDSFLDNFDTNKTTSPDKEEIKKSNLQKGKSIYFGFRIEESLRDAENLFYSLTRVRSGSEAGVLTKVNSKRTGNSYPVVVASDRIYFLQDKTIYAFFGHLTEIEFKNELEKIWEAWGI